MITYKVLIRKSALSDLDNLLDFLKTVMSQESPPNIPITNRPYNHNHIFLLNLTSGYRSIFLYLLQHTDL